MKMNDFIEESSGNVFVDLDMQDAKELLVKAELVSRINKIINQRKLKQVAAAEVLGVDQAKISLLARGRLTAFSIERLVKYLNLLDQDIDIVIKNARHREGHGRIRVRYA